MNVQDIRPFEGLGDLKLGMPRPAVRQLLGNPSSTFRKTPIEPFDTDVFQELRLLLYYDENEQLDFIEALRGSDPVFEGVHLFRDDLSQTLRRLAERGYTTSYDDEGYNFKDSGFVLYVPEDEIKAVSIYVRGYFA